MMRALARRRARTGADLFAGYVVHELVGPGPWHFGAFFAGWRRIADVSLVNGASPRGKIGGRPLRGFGARWAKQQLAGIGYVAAGSLTVPRARVKMRMPNDAVILDRATGAVQYEVRKGAPIDTRVIHRTAQ